eukprot:TRINITY_DN39167_c0_g1_i1.p1 TRINITY_DN39167_c0_g1~~TRINITY_DN39167_c0_g1_i1.p1  ORF type:complete len:516 (+),score=80.45 TRINITY_DN39167_c0_g1_i1:94-1548(+)
MAQGYRAPPRAPSRTAQPLPDAQAGVDATGLAAAAAMCWGPFDEAAPEAERRAFHWDAEFFRPFADSSGAQPGQTVDEFRSAGFRRHSSGGRRTVYLQPLGPCWSHSFALAEAKAAAKQHRKRREDAPVIVPPQLDAMRRFLSAFLGGVHCVLLDPLPLPGGRRGRAHARGAAARELRGRTNENNGSHWKVQLYGPDVLDWVRMHAPGDSYITIGVTHHDLYDDPAASHCLSVSGDGVACVSFARLDPVFHGCARATHAKRLLPGRSVRSQCGDDSSDPEGTTSESAVRRATEPADNWYLWTLKRVCRLMGHAALHAVGARVCRVFECLLNPSGLEDVDAPQRTLLCVVCLKKLHLATGCDLLRRYQLLGRFFWDYQTAFGAESVWVGSRFEWIARGASRLQLPIAQPAAAAQEEPSAEAGGAAAELAEKAGAPRVTAPVPAQRTKPASQPLRRSSSRSRYSAADEPTVALGMLCSCCTAPPAH